MSELIISMWSECFGQEMVCNYSRLGETVHPFAYFFINTSVFPLILKVVLHNYLIRCDVHWKENVLITIYYCAKMKVLMPQHMNCTPVVCRSSVILHVELSH